MFSLACPTCLIISVTLLSQLVPGARNQNDIIVSIKYFRIFLGGYLIGVIYPGILQQNNLFIKAILLIYHCPPPVLWLHPILVLVLLSYYYDLKPPFQYLIWVEKSINLLSGSLVSGLTCFDYDVIGESKKN